MIFPPDIHLFHKYTSDLPTKTIAVHVFDSWIIEKYEKSKGLFAKSILLLFPFCHRKKIFEKYLLLEIMA